VVERSRILPANVSVGDVLVGIDSPNIRANGFTLVRDTFFKNAQRDINGPAWEGASESLGDVLLQPSVIYSPLMQDIYATDIDVHACAHITGGGLAGNVVRVLHDNVDAVIERGTWDIPPIFAEIQRQGNIADAEMEKVFNLGIGYVIVVPKEHVKEIETICSAHGRTSYVIGAIAQGSGKVTLQ
jgi:phosphoribosylformylglycinamidine cyclo-ligase